MKRKISLVIALVPSFVMMFGSIARAEGIKVQIPVPTSESSEIIIKVPLAQMNKADFPPPQEKASTQLLQGEEQMSKTEEKKCAYINGCGECDVGGFPGRWLDVRIFGSYTLRNCVECI
jgi:hypothetical protein